MLAQGGGKPLSDDSTPEETYFDGQGGLCKYYTITNKAIKSSTLHGGGTFVVLCCACALVMALLGLIIDIGTQQDIEPKYHLWVIFGAAGACCSCCFGFCVGTVRREVNTLETRLVTDIELNQNFIQNCGKAKKAKLTVFSLDPSTPFLVIKCPGAYDIFHKIRADIDKMRGNADHLIEEITIHKRRYGAKVLAICGTWGLLPNRDYDITSRTIKTEETDCCCLYLNHTSMARVYDMEMSQNVIQFLCPIVLPCLRKCCAQYDRGTIRLFTFDRSGGALVLRPADAFVVFDAIREYIDAKNACTFYWTQAKTIGIVHGHFAKNKVKK
jgi:hypothetical protein